MHWVCFYEITHYNLENSLVVDPTWVTKFLRYSSCTLRIIGVWNEQSLRGCKVPSLVQTLVHVLFTMSVVTVSDYWSSTCLSLVRFGMKGTPKYFTLPRLLTDSNLIDLFCNSGNETFGLTNIRYMRERQIKRKQERVTNLHNLQGQTETT